MEFLVLSVFCLALLGCIVFDLSVLVALGIGFLLFFSYGLWQRHTVPEMLQMAWNGVKTVKNILLTFLLIGMLTALWRGAGTIAVIICSCAGLIRPGSFLLAAFLLNCLISFLTGTSFGTSATMGVITMTMARAMQIDPLLTGGAVLSGAFFGDRCSPVSTSALLVSTLTKTDIYENIRRMLRTAAVPFLAAAGLYLFLGLSGGGGETPDVRSLFSGEFRLQWIAVLPAAVIVILSLLRVRVKGTMLVSICTAIPVCLFLQGMPAETVTRLLVFGFRAEDPSVAALLDGGGILSMARVSAIVCLSSSYAGIFEGTHMLDGIRSRIARLGKRLPAFAGMLLVSVFTSAVSCNQTLAIILTDQLCCRLEPDEKKRAIGLENAPVLVAPMIPWSIAGAVPIAAIGAESKCLVAAFFLYLVPLWYLFTEIIIMKRGKG